MCVCVCVCVFVHVPVGVRVNRCLLRKTVLLESYSNGMLVSIALVSMCT